MRARMVCLCVFERMEACACCEGCYHDRVGLVPFGSKTAGQAFLVIRVLPVENGIRRANKGGQRSLQVLAGLSVLLPLRFSGFSSDGVPR